MHCNVYSLVNVYDLRVEVLITTRRTNDNQRSSMLRGFAKKKCQKSEFSMEVGGWPRSHSDFVVENHPKIAPNQH